MNLLKRKWGSCPWIASDRAGLLLLVLLTLSLCAALPCVAQERSPWLPLLERLEEDGFNDPETRSLFLRPDLRFDPAIMARKMNALLNTRRSATKPGQSAPPAILDRYTNPLLIAGAYAYLCEHSESLDRAEAVYGVEGEVLVAILLVETKLGTTMGKNKVLSILSSMALADDVEDIRPFLDKQPGELTEWLKKRTAQKAEWAYMELKALLTYAAQNGLDVAAMPGSMYGAIGLCQFIPSSALNYGVDGDGDGRIDLFSDRDAIHSVANYLKKNGWRREMDKERQLKVVYRYNHSESYALTILDVADRLRRTRAMFGN